MRQPLKCAPFRDASTDKLVKPPKSIACFDKLDASKELESGCQNFFCFNVIRCAECWISGENGSRNLTRLSAQTGLSGSLGLP